MNEKNLLASLAVFRELYDKETDIWKIIASFINDLIIENRLNAFTISEISILFNQTYEFDVPSSVIKSSLSKLSYLTRSANSYIVNQLEESSTLVLDEKTLIENSHKSIFEGLSRYVEEKKNKSLSVKEEKDLYHNFCNYLLDENNGDEYLEYISSYIVENDNNNDFISKLKVIREGVILHSGLKYTNEFTDFNDFGNWRKELVIFLDTEIIFHLAGYNGDVYKEIAFDFLNFTKEINTKSRDRKLIKLLYFPEAKNEIEGFFTKAKHILEKNETLNPRVTAMVDILKNVTSQSDLISKKSDLYTFLHRNDIQEYTNNIEVTSRENFEYNIISNELVEEINKYLKIDNSESILEIFNKISILRKNNTEENFENVRYILLSGNSKTIKAAFNTSVFERFRIPLATSLNFIINRFWFKLNKGFSQKDFPSSFNILTKSQIILSKILNDSIGEKYDELQTKFRNGDITKEQAINRIKDLRIQSKKPEEIKQEIANDVLDFITIDSLEDYIENQAHYKEKSKKFDEISIKLKEKTKDSIIFKEQLIQNIKDRITEKKEIIYAFNNVKSISSTYSSKVIKRLRLLLFFILLTFYLALIISIIYYGWDKMEKYTYLLGIPFTVFLLGTTIFKKQVRFENVLESIKIRIEKNEIEKKSKHTPFEIENLRTEIKQLEEEISTLEKDQ
nr:hypothetical protein [uncultured Chryseobacterium sp.]